MQVPGDRKRGAGQREQTALLKLFQWKILLVVFFILIFLNCKKYQNPGDPNTIVYAMYEDVKDWDPAVAFSLEVLPLANIYEPLHWYTGDSSGGYHFRPGLAKSFQKSADGLNWTFQLRSNVKFHDGTDFTSLAVKKTIERVQRLGRGAAFIWAAVRDVETPDDTTVVFKLSYPAPIDLIAASQYSAWIMSPAIADCTDSYFLRGNASGTGPYKLDYWEQDNEIALKKFDQYWGGWPKEHFENVKLKLVSEPATRVQLIRTGEADFAGVIPPENIAAMKHNPEVEVVTYDSWRNAMFLLNVSKPPLNDPLLRRAILHAFDYEAAIEHIYHGYAERATAPVAKGMWGRAENLTQPTFDLEKARSYLAKSNIDADKLNLEMAYVSSVDAYHKCAMMLQNNLAQIGIDLELKPGMWNVIWEDAKKLESAPHIQSMVWWPSYATPGDWLAGLFRTQQPNLFNLSHYSNPAFDAAVDEAMILEGTNLEKSTQLYQSAQEMLYNDAAAIFVADLKVRLVKRKSARFRQFRPNPAYEAIYFYNLYRDKNPLEENHKPAETL